MLQFLELLDLGGVGCGCNYFYWGKGGGLGGAGWLLLLLQLQQLLATLLPLPRWLLARNKRGSALDGH